MVHQHRPEHVVHVIAIQLDRWARRRLAPMQPTSHRLATGNLAEQRHGSVRSGQGAIAGQSLLKAAAGLRSQSDAAGRLAHQLGGEDSCLQPDGGGAIAHRRFSPAHQPCQGNRPAAVGHHQGLSVQLTLLPIEAEERFTRLGRPQTQGPRIGHPAAAGDEGLAIKSVQGLARLQHHQIGDVDNVVDGPHTGALEATLQP